MFSVGIWRERGGGWGECGGSKEGDLEGGGGSFGVVGECVGPAKIHHHYGTCPRSVCSPTPRSQIKKQTYDVINFLGKTREKGTHRRSGKGIHCASWGPILLETAQKP